MPNNDDDLWGELDGIAAQLSGLERNVLHTLVTSRNMELRATCLSAGPADSPARANAAAAWAVAAAVDVAYRDWTNMFTGLSAAEGKRLAAESRGEVATDNRSLTYGEVRTIFFTQNTGYQLLLRFGLSSKLARALSPLLECMSV